VQLPAPGEEQAHASTYAGATQLESSLAEKDSGVLVVTKLKASQKCAPVAKVNGTVASIR